MHTLNRYILEYRIEKNRKLYDVCLYVSPILRIIAVVQVLPAILVSLYFLIGIFLCVVLSIASDRISLKCIYTLRYEWNNGLLSIIKVNLDGNALVMENIGCSEMKNVCICSEAELDAKNYTVTDKVSQKENLLLKIEYNGESIFMSSDEYMYALLCKGREYGLS